jgi:pyocin large subunit-like protein
MNVDSLATANGLTAGNYASAETAPDNTELHCDENSQGCADQ